MARQAVSKTVVPGDPVVGVRLLHPPPFRSLNLGDVDQYGDGAGCRPAVPDRCPQGSTPCIPTNPPRCWPNWYEAPGSDPGGSRFESEAAHHCRSSPTGRGTRSRAWVLRVRVPRATPSQASPIGRRRQLQILDSAGSNPAPGTIRLRSPIGRGGRPKPGALGVRIAPEPPRRGDRARPRCPVATRRPAGEPGCAGSNPALSAKIRTPASCLAGAQS